MRLSIYYWQSNFPVNNTIWKCFFFIVHENYNVKGLMSSLFRFLFTSNWIIHSYLALFITTTLGLIGNRRIVNGKIKCIFHMWRWWVWSGHKSDNSFERLLMSLFRVATADAWFDSIEGSFGWCHRCNLWPRSVALSIRSLACSSAEPGSGRAYNWDSLPQC